MTVEVEINYNIFLYIIIRIIMKYLLILLSFSITFLISAESVKTNTSLTQINKKHISKFYKKYIQKSCRFTCTSFAQRHSEEEWISIKKKKVFFKELLELCPNDIKNLKNTMKDKKNIKNLSTLLHFAIKYSHGSNNYYSE